MFESKADYIPLLEAIGPEFQFRGFFPIGTPVSEIGVNTKRIHRLCRIAGISQIVITGSSNEQSSKTSYILSGVDSSGEATAAKVLQSKGSLFNTDDEYYPHKNDKDALHSLRWRRANITMDFNEMTHRVLNEDKARKGIRSVDIWSDYLEKGVKSGIEKVGLKNLLMGYTPKDIVFAGFAISMGAQMAASRLSQYEGPSLSGELFFWFLLGYGLPKGGELLGIVTQPPKKHGRRMSLFPGPELERAAALMMVSRTSKLFRELDLS